jgi:hypothetical protein
MYVQKPRSRCPNDARCRLSGRKQGRSGRHNDIDIEAHESEAISVARFSLEATN